MLALSVARAQVASSSLLGVVADQSSAPVAGVVVTARHQATGFSRSAVTESAGQYRIDDLLPGSYTVTAEKQGFRTVTTGAVELEVNQKGRVDLQLEVGTAREAVTVEAEASPVQSDDASIGYLLHSATVLSLPLQTRNVASLVTLGPGAIPRQLGGFTNDANSDYQGSRGLVQSNPPVNGARSSANTWLLDGAVNTDRLVFAQAINPPLESVQEFRIQSSMAPAEFSQAGGAVVDVVTKSGGRNFHGSAFEYFRNEATDARNFFDDPALPRPILRQNQFGGSVGGPVPLRDTFFFATYEGVRGRQASASVSLVPDPAVRGGDFSGGSPIFDPLTLAPGTNVRSPFPGNVIPASRIDSVAKNYLRQYEPLPNRSDPTNNYLDSTPNQAADDSVSARIDHQFHNQSTLFGRYTINDQRDRVNSAFPLRPTAENVRAQQAAAGYIIGGGRWLNEAR
ncbi:MAG TPA: carboxypeptidase-like regulatory domain-containing protein, partial [Candidatus Sulfopaludibacter sp.]|nr:carboxypeptidase-like regulatory domain-containing protein [Candidatus Sulfopaludibacter sp.]